MGTRWSLSHDPARNGKNIFFPSGGQNMQCMEKFNEVKNYGLIWLFEENGLCSFIISQIGQIMIFIMPKVANMFLPTLCVHGYVPAQKN